jgi:cyclopropane fatty-acyl-phospholipid synthase-like methyltransferase
MMLLYLALIISIVANLIFAIIYLQKNKNANSVTPASDPEDVGQFYDKYNDKFIQVYGKVIQAFRTTDISKLLDYQIASIGFEKGQIALDAGCGVCGPAIYFAKNAGISVSAITMSEEQVRRAAENIAEENVGDKVRVQKADYHKMAEVVEKESVDVVYFLESFGHSHNHGEAIASSWEVLKPGGVLYIKDLFKKIAVLQEHEQKIEIEINKINQAYHYNIADLYEVLHLLRKKGFILSFVKTIDLKLEDFENLTISNDFQELTGIAKIENWEDYIFPVDFFEIKCHKPWNNILFGNSRYFLQNLYHMKIWGKQAEEL